MKFPLFASTIAALALSPFAESWYKVPLTTFSAMEVNGSQIILSQDFPNWDVNTTVYDASNAAWQAKKVVVQPPSGQFNAWQAMIMSGLANGGNLWIKAGLNSNTITSSTLPGDNRIILEQ